MIIIGLTILSSIIWFAAGVAFGYRKGFVRGTRNTTSRILALTNEEMEKKLYMLVKQATDDLNVRWGKFMGFSDTDIKKAKEEATKEYERKLN